PRKEPGTAPTRQSDRSAPPRPSGVRQPEVFLDLPYVLADLRELLQAHHHAKLVGRGSGRNAKHSLIGRDVLVHAALRAPVGPVAHPTVIANANLATHCHIVARDNRPGQTALGSQKVVPPNLTVVCDLDVVIDLCAGADPRRSKRGPIDGRTSADLDVV